jgi:hypothetical protein
METWAKFGLCILMLVWLPTLLLGGILGFGFLMAIFIGVREMIRDLWDKLFRHRPPPSSFKVISGRPKPGGTYGKVKVRA